MSNKIFVNLDYGPLDKDFEKFRGTNPDGSVNVKYTLTMLHKNLQNNAKIISKLLENVNYINSISVANSCLMEVETESTNIWDNILNVRTEEPDNGVDDFPEENDETNYDRYKLITNMTNYSNPNIQMENVELTSSEDESDQEIVDKKNLDHIFEKYVRIVPTIFSDSENDL
ncbi:MAG: hypothetical protein QW303_04975 [Nitrososphaerota archaeon]